MAVARQVASAAVVLGALLLSAATILYHTGDGHHMPVQLRITRPRYISDSNVTNRTAVQAVVVFETWWSNDYGKYWTVPDCKVNGRTIGCSYLSAQHVVGNETLEALAQHADVFVGHLCYNRSSLQQQFRQLPQVMFGMESQANYPCMQQQLADVEMTYRTCSQVQGFTGTTWLVIQDVR